MVGGCGTAPTAVTTPAQTSVPAPATLPLPTLPVRTSASSVPVESPPARTTPDGTVAGAMPTLTAQPLTPPRQLVLPEAADGPPARSLPARSLPARSLPAEPLDDPEPATTSRAGRGGTAVAEADAVRLTNAARVAAGCQALRVDARLTAAARRHSRDMAVRGYFAHTPPGGRDPFQRMAAAGYRHGAAENIAAGQDTAERVVQDWLNSPDHRANLLDCALDDVGIGLQIVATSPMVYYWTQDFGDRS